MLAFIAERIDAEAGCRADRLGDQEGTHDHVVVTPARWARSVRRCSRRPAPARWAGYSGHTANSGLHIFGRAREAMHAVVDPEAPPDLAVFERKRSRFSDKQDDPTGSPDSGPALGLHRRFG